MNRFEGGSFIQPQGNGPKREQRKASQEPKETLYPGIDADMRRLMGLREYKRISVEEERELFVSEDRLKAYNQITTNTNPVSRHRENKKGIVREIVGKKLIDEPKLKEQSTVYLGSGTDIEYPLALGARDIYFIDPIYKAPEGLNELKLKIESIIGTIPVEQIDHLLSFQFDFGSGEELVNIHLVPKMYSEEKIALPDNIGLILMYASQGPKGKVEISEDLIDRMSDGAAILKETRMEKKVGENMEITELGR